MLTSLMLSKSNVKLTTLVKPNGFNGPVVAPGMKEPPLKISADAYRYNHRNDNEEYRYSWRLDLWLIRYWCSASAGAKLRRQLLVPGNCNHSMCI